MSVRSKTQVPTEKHGHGWEPLNCSQRSWGGRGRRYRREPPTDGNVLGVRAGRQEEPADWGGPLQTLELAYETSSENKPPRISPAPGGNLKPVLCPHNSQSKKSNQVVKTRACVTDTLAAATPPINKAFTACKTRGGGEGGISLSPFTGPADDNGVLEQFGIDDGPQRCPVTQRGDGAHLEAR